MDSVAASQMEEIKVMLADIQPLQEEDNESIWLVDKLKRYTVNACYSKMIPCLTELSSNLLDVVSIIWKMMVP